MSDTQPHPSWWLGTDGKWYPPMSPAQPGGSPAASQATSGPPTAPPDAAPQFAPPGHDERPVVPAPPTYPAPSTPSPGVTGAPPAPARGCRRAVVAVVVIAVLAGAAAGVGVWLSRRDTSSTATSKTVYVTVETDQGGRTAGRLCSGFGLTADLKPGTTVTVRGPDGAVLSVGSLADGIGVNTGVRTVCRMPVNFPDGIPDASAYTFEISGRGSAPVSASAFNDPAGVDLAVADASAGSTRGELRRA